MLGLPRRTAGVLVVLALLGSPGAATAATMAWPAYLHGPGHESVSASRAITPANAAGLVQAWRWSVPAPVSGQPGNSLYASPTVAGGRVFVGANTGRFFALAEATGAVLWSRDLGHLAALTCGARGIISTAAVAPDPGRGGRSTVYVGGGDGNLYALDAATGQLVWRTLASPPSPTVNGYYNWSSPTVVAGRVYLGVSSQCDTPFVPGGVKAYDQSTGRPLGAWFGMPAGLDGSGVWTSVAATLDGRSIFATTGSTTPPPYPQGDSYSIVRLDGATMAKEDIWTVPDADRAVDADFGASPTLFHATLAGATADLVAACNKNGLLYAWRADDLAAGPVWKRRIDAGPSSFCFAAPVWDGTSLLQAGGATVIGGSGFDGSVRRLDPATGRPAWQVGIGAAVVGSASLSGGGVLAAPTMDTTVGARNGVYLLDAATGRLITVLLPGAREFAQPVFADRLLLLATISAGLVAYRAP